MDVNLFLVFLAGLGSFLSPCVLPLVPSYLAFLSGEVQSQRTFLPTLGFVLGFSGVFILLGLTIAGIGGALSAIPGIFALLTLLAGLFLILLGLHLSFGLFPFFYREVRYHVESSAHAVPAGELKTTTDQIPGGKERSPILKRFLRALSVGAAFGAGWIPCIGPILAAVLTLAASSQNPWLGSGYLAVYSLGLGVPFLLASGFIGTFTQVKAKITRYLGVFQKISGYILIGFGVLIASGRFQLFTSAIIQGGLWLGDFAHARPQMSQGIVLSFIVLLIGALGLLIVQKKKQTGKVSRGLIISTVLVTGIGILEASGILQVLNLVALWLQFEGF